MKTFGVEFRNGDIKAFELSVDMAKHILVQQIQKICVERTAYFFM